MNLYSEMKFGPNKFMTKKPPFKKTFIYLLNRMSIIIIFAIEHIPESIPSKGFE